MTNWPLRPGSPTVRVRRGSRRRRRRTRIAPLRLVISPSPPATPPPADHSWVTPWVCLGGFWLLSQPAVLFGLSLALGFYLLLRTERLVDEELDRP